MALPLHPLRGQDRDRDSVAFSLVEESAKILSEKCFYPRTVPEVLKGVVEALAKQGIDVSRAPQDLAALSETEAWPLFKQFMQELSTQPGQRLNLTDLLETGLRHFCPTVDDWTKYYTVADFGRIKRGSAAGTGSIGVNLRESGEGDVFMYPLPGSPAGFAGIKPGDKLLSVDGRKLEGKPIELVASWIKGEPGSQTNLRVERRDGRSELVAINREELNTSPLQVEKDLSGLTVRIRFFTRDLADLLTQALAGTSGARGVTIDLRGCIGGSMLAAVETADLFLPVGKRILTLSERGQEVQHFDSKKEPVIQPRSISLLQDEGTASAAEIFIAALVENLPKQAASAGEKSYGKGVVQLEQELAAGGKLHVTTGVLFGPGGKSWNSVGLLPSVSHAGNIYPEQSTLVTNPGAKPKAKVRLVE
jgi:carboxyl-terminal processing protease